MKKTQPTKQIPRNKPAISQLKPTYYILLFAYLFVPVFTPNFFTLDTNGPKFTALALLNLISFLILATDRQFKQRTEMQAGFFRNFIGLAYALFMVITLLSFLQAYNLSESIINFAKLFSVFTSTYILYVIFSSNRTYILHIAIALTFLLLFECFTVFYHILEYVNKNVDSIYDIKSVYSHKNILSAALFIKIPAAVWLMVFADGWSKKLGYFVSFLGAIAVLFMSSRAFYLGLAILIIALALYFIKRNFLIKRDLSFKKVLLFAGLFVFALIIFSMIQKYFYPVNQDTKSKFNTGIIDRFATFKTEAKAKEGRVASWKRSFILIKEHPLLGVGTGNWKIEVLKYEAPFTETHIISYKNHNDFIEVTAETGIFGGLAYLSIFILILFSFISIASDRNADEEKMKSLFLPAFGIIAYSMDAAFNFPNDRPEIQALFAMYVGIAIAYSNPGLSIPAKSNFPFSIQQKNIHKMFFRFIKSTMLTLIAGSCAILYLNAKSLHFQRYVIEDLEANAYSHPSSFFINGFPDIPNLSCDGAPIKTYFARYLINENRSNEAIKLLSYYNPSPYDGRREYYMSMAYNTLGIEDSTIVWGLKACKLKPLHANMVLIVSSKLYNAGRFEEASQIIDYYLENVKTNPEAWIQAFNQNRYSGQEEKALSILDSAKKYLPYNMEILDNWRMLHNAFYIKPYEELFLKANQAGMDKRYDEALNLLNDFISKKPDYTEAYQTRALTLYYLGLYSRSLFDIEKALSRGDGNEAFLINLRGVNEIGLGQIEAACKDFIIASEKGNADGISNYKKFCEEK